MGRLPVLLSCNDGALANEYISALRGAQGIRVSLMEEIQMVSVQLRRFATFLAMVLGLLVVPATAADAAPRPPDLLPTIIKFNRPVVAGQNVYFDSGIRNTGGQGTGVFNIKWLVDGREIGAYGSHEDVPSGSSKLNGNSQFNHTFGDPGSFHTVTFIVDADNHVIERFEGNNRQSVQVQVR